MERRRRTVAALVLAGGLLLEPGGALAQSPAEVERQMKPSSGIEPVEQPWYASWPLWAMVAGVALMGIATGAILAGRSARARAGGPAGPHTRALAELAQLEQLDLPGRGELERYHTELSNIVRRYLESRFRLPATEQTTPEFLESMKSAACLDDDQRRLLRDFLEQCDLVKFARITPSAEESRSLATAARRFIEQTALRPA
jgi:uncharacterized membrane protein